MCIYANYVLYIYICICVYLFACMCEHLYQYTSRSILMHVCVYTDVTHPHMRLYVIIFSSTPRGTSVVLTSPYIARRHTL